MEHVLGSASVRRVRLMGFPTSKFVHNDGETLAGLGRDGWFRVFFGRGRRIELPDGTKWRIASVPIAGFIMPVVTCEDGKLVEAAPRGNRSYGINGRDYAYMLYRMSSNESERSRWLLREHDTELATFTARTIHAGHPIPLAAALICLTVIKFGVPGEADLGIPALQWTAR